MEPNPKTPTPLPMREMFPLALVLLNESLCFTVLLPYVGFLVSFFENRPAEDAGYVSGVVFGSFMLGQCLSSKMWGCLSDSYGRKPTLVLGLIIGGVMVLCFGFSSNIWTCVIFRFLHGLSNGNLLVAKTVLADILDRSNETKGFAMVSFTYGIGILIGPAMGGLLYDPVNSSVFRWVGFSKDGVFAHFPGLLPAVACFVYAVFALVVCLMFLHETNPSARPLPGWIAFLLPASLRTRAAYEAVEGNKNVETVAVKVESNCYFDSHQGAVRSSGDWKDVAVCDDAIYPRSKEERPCRIGDEDKHVNIIDTCDQSGDQMEREYAGSSAAPCYASSGVGTTAERRQKFGFRESFMNPNTRCVLVTYMLICSGDVAYCEIFSLWAIAGTSHGGLGYKAGAVGILLLTNSLPSLLSNVTLHLASRVITDTLLLWRISVLVLALSVGFMPFVTYAAAGAHIPLLLLCTFTRQWFSSWAFGLMTLFTARVAPQYHTGTMYGIAQSCGSIVRCVIPFAITPLFAWSISGDKIIPFNHTLTFLIASAMFVVSCVGSYGLNIESQDFQVEKPVEHDARKKPEIGCMVAADCELCDGLESDSLFAGVKG